VEAVEYAEEERAAVGGRVLEAATSGCEIYARV
jgi:hypothetical protein